MGLLAGLLIALPLAGCAAPGGGGAPRIRSSGKGAPWTILCLELRGPYRMQNLEQIASVLRQTQGIDPSEVSVQDGLDETARLYYGTYWRRTNPKDGRRETPEKLRQDLAMIKQLTDGAGTYFFRQALVVRKPTPDVGHPEWVLTRANGAYTLQVAAFEPTDAFWEYKQAAAEYCAYLRKQGLEAYYLHSDACSIVTVGAFGPDAVVETRVPVQSGGYDEEKPPPPPGAAQNHAWAITTTYSPEVLRLQRHELCRYNLVNGAIVRPREGDKVGEPVPSMLVPIPTAQAVPTAP